MAADRPRNPRRTPKVAGRGAPRVGAGRAAGPSKPEAEQNVDAVAASTEPTTTEPTTTEPTTTGRASPEEAATAETSTEQTSTEPATTEQVRTAPPVARSTSLRKPGADDTSGVERKRARVEAERVDQEKERAAREVEPGVRDSNGTRQLAAILGGAAVVIAAIAAALGFHPGATDSDNRAFVDQGETDKVLSQLRERACVPLQYDHTKVPEWMDRNRASLTGSALDEFEKFAKASREMIEQTKSSSDCRVDTVGLSDLRGDTAVAIGNLIVSTTQNGAIAGNDAPRVQYGLVRKDGQWLIESLAPF